MSSYSLFYMVWNTNENKFIICYFCMYFLFDKYVSILMESRNTTSRVLYARKDVYKKWVCNDTHTLIYIYIYTYTRLFFVWALLLVVHIWKYNPLRSNLLRLQCTCCTVLTTSRRPHGSSLVWECQWPSSQPLSSPQLSHNDSLWA